MDDVRTRLLSVAVDVVHVVALRQEHIQLDGDHGVFLAVDIFRLDVQLRTVEGSFAFFLGIFETDFIQDIAHQILHAVPGFGVAQVVVGVIRIPLGESVCHIFFEAQSGQAVSRQVYAALEFVADLFRRADQMSLGNGELAHACESVHFACLLVSEQGRGLAHSVWQVAVTLLASLIYIVLERAGHRTQRVYIRVCVVLDQVQILHAADLIGSVLRSHDFVHAVIAQQEHAVSVVVPVVGNFVESRFRHQRRASAHVTPFIFLQVLDPALHLLDDFRSLRHEERQTLTDDIHSREQFHLAAQFVVIAVLDVSQIRQVFFELVFLRVGCTVDSGEHLVLLVASPVSSGA